MASDIERVRKLIGHIASGGLRDVNPQIAKYEREISKLVERARKQARRDLEEWIRVVEIEAKKGHSLVELSGRPMRLSWWDRKTLPIEPSVDRTFLLEGCDRSDARIFGEAYARELKVLLGEPFFTTYHEGYLSDHDTSPSWRSAKVCVSWPGPT